MPTCQHQISQQVSSFPAIVSVNYDDLWKRCVKKQIHFCDQTLASFERLVTRGSIKYRNGFNFFHDQICRMTHSFQISETAGGKAYLGAEHFKTQSF